MFLQLSSSLASLSFPNLGNSMATPVQKKRKVGDLLLQLTDDDNEGSDGPRLNRTPSLSTISLTPAIKRRLALVAKNRPRKGDSPVSASTPLQFGIFAPHYRPHFIQRLQTYRRGVWSPKPSEINEVAWSKRGWICAAYDKVSCPTCKAEEYVKMEIKDDEQTEKDESQTLQIGQSNSLLMQ